jgi:hypothetical protein
VSRLVESKSDEHQHKANQGYAAGFNPVELTTTNSINDGTLERATSFKLLGLTIANNLSCEDHIKSVCYKASKRLHFLKLLKRCSVSDNYLLHYYKSVIRPTIEYACPVWQSVLTNGQRDRLESLQRRALKLISNSCDYELYCVTYDIEPSC